MKYLRPTTRLARSLTAIFAIALVARSAASTFTFVPSTPDLGDLEHGYAYTWGITGTSGGSSYTTLKNQIKTGGGYYISSAKLSISQIYNWDIRDTTNQLFIHLLDNPRTGIRTIGDNPSDGGINQGTVSDYFSGKISTNYVNGSWKAYGYTSSGSLVSTGATNIYLAQYHDADGPRTAINYNFSFTGTQLSTLSSYILNGHTGGSYYADFGIGFDPDCHFYNLGITFEILTAPVPPPVVYVSDRSWTAGLLLLGIAALWRRHRRGLAARP